MIVQFRELSIEAIVSLKYSDTFYMCKNIREEIY